MKKLVSVLMILCLVPLIVSCNDNDSLLAQITNGDNFPSQATNSETTSSESLTNSCTTSENEYNQESSSTSSTRSSEEASNNSSKENSSNTSSNTSSTNKNTYKQATDRDNNVTVDSNGIVSITIPKWFLLKMEPNFNYQLTDKEVNSYKFISITKNSDGSATYKIGYNDYHGFLIITKSSVNGVVNKYKNNIWFSEISADSGYNNIKIYTNYDSLEEFDDDFGVYITMSGIQTTFYQYVNYNFSVGTTITVYNKDNVILETYKFPDLIK